MKRAWFQSSQDDKFCRIPDARLCLRAGLIFEGCGRQKEGRAGRGRADFSGILGRQWSPTKVAFRKAAPSLQSACAILSPHLFTPRTGPEVTDSTSRVWLLGSVPGLLARQLAYQLCDLWQVTQFPSCERDMAVVSGHRVVCTESITTCRRF